MSVVFNDFPEGEIHPGGFVLAALELPSVQWTNSTLM